MFSQPSLFQPEAGLLVRSEKSVNGASPAKPMILQSPEAYFDPHLRVLTALRIGGGFSPVFGEYAHSFTDLTGIMVKNGSASFRLAIGKLSSKQVGGLALRK